MADVDPPVALVTGANGVIGQAIAHQIAAAGHQVVIVCRDERRAQRAVKDIRSTTNNDRVRYEIADLSRHESIRHLAMSWKGPLHVLVNNAAETPRQRQETADGIERQFATNVLGYFWMIRELAARLEESAPSRVVNVASYWAGGLQMGDLEFKSRSYDNDAAYRQSKQADRMLTVAFVEELAARSITINSCHPGDVPSTLASNLGFGGSQTADQAAETPAWLATRSDAKATGKYYARRREAHCEFAADAAAAQQLYEVCAGYK